MKNSIINTFLFCVLIVCAKAQPKTVFLADPGSGPREHSVDIERMTLDVSFVPEKGLVKGKVTHVFHLLQNKVDSLFFDAPSIIIREALLNGAPVKFDTGPKGVTIRAKLKREEKQSGGKKIVKSDSVTFVYEAIPAKGIYFIGWNANKNIFNSQAKNFNETRKQIWTQGQGIDNRYWIPMYDDMDDKMITETTVTFDKDYKVLSNGTKLSEKDNKDGTKTWHYRMIHPHASYLLMLGIGKFDVKSSKSSSGVPIYSYYYPEFPDRVLPTYMYTEKMMDFLEKETGMPYPWESYSQMPVQEFIYGAMENTTATIFGDFLLVDKFAYNDRNYIGVNAHEMTHQYFGDYITARSSRHSWLQESFATHYSKHFKRSVFGEDEFQWDRRNEMNSAINASKTDRNPIVHTKSGSARVYPKGSLVLDMMRTVLGDEEYKRGINFYLKKHPYENVDTHEFMLAFQDELGVNLDWFFEEWLYKGGEPQYEVSWRNAILNPEKVPTGDGQTIFSYGGQATEVTVEQTHLVDDFTGLFKMPIRFQVYYSDGSSDEKTEIISKQNQSVSIPNQKGKNIDFVLFDPGNQILKTVTFRKALPELKSQALKAKNMIDRYDAIAAMRDSSLQSKRDILIEVFGAKNGKEFYAIKNEIIAQLADDTDAKSISILQRALNDEDQHVRIAAIQNIKKIGVTYKGGFEKALADSSYDMIQTALEKLCTQFPAGIPSYLEQTKNFQGPGNSVRIKSIEMSALTEQPGQMQELIEMCGSGYEFRTRINAMNALQRLNYMDATVIGNLFDAMLSPNNRLAGPATEVMNVFYKQDAKKKTVQAFYSSKTWTAKEKEVLEKYSK